LSDPAHPPRALKPAERKRLREVWRSAGWPYQDPLEIDLLAAGWLERCMGPDGQVTVRLTDAGIATLASASQQHRHALEPHEALVRRVAQALAQDGRLAWRGLALRAPLQRMPEAAGSPPAALPLWPDDESEEVSAGFRWVVAMPDVFSIRVSTLAGALEPRVHEIKVRRADLLADLRLPDKGAAYRALAGSCTFVLAEGIAEPEEVPVEYGVVLARADRLELIRPAPRQPLPAWPNGLPLATWLALARALPEPAPDEPLQTALKALTPKGERPAERE